MTDSVPDWSLSTRSTQTHAQLCRFCTLIITAVTDRKLSASKRLEKEERRKRKSNILLLRFFSSLGSLPTPGLIKWGPWFILKHSWLMASSSQVIFSLSFPSVAFAVQVVQIDVTHKTTSWGYWRAVVEKSVFGHPVFMCYTALWVTWKPPNVTPLGIVTPKLQAPTCMCTVPFGLKFDVST